jgi:glutamate 5-kinase
LEDRTRHLNARNTLLALLRNPKVIPIINENDTVSVTELKFGDNDKLSALVASLLPADLLVILTTVDGVIEHFGQPGARVLPLITDIDAGVEDMAGDTTSATAVGGMASKVQAAKIVVRSGIPLVIASGRHPRILADILSGKNVGTIFEPRAQPLRSRKRWIAFFHHPKGQLHVDDGARRAIYEKGKSLLPPGVVRCEGEFAVGDVVRICDLDGTEFARGIARFNSRLVRDHQCPREALVHRDDLVIL